jgi:hypothetical protein
VSGTPWATPARRTRHRLSGGELVCPCPPGRLGSGGAVDDDTGAGGGEQYPGPHVVAEREDDSARATPGPRRPSPLRPAGRTGRLRARIRALLRRARVAGRTLGAWRGEPDERDVTVFCRRLGGRLVQPAYSHWRMCTVTSVHISCRSDRFAARPDDPSKTGSRETRLRALCRYDTFRRPDAQRSALREPEPAASRVTRA